MTRRMLSVVFVLAILPAVAAANANQLVVQSRNVDSLIVKLADWSKEFDWPDGPRAVYRVLFCQKRAWREPKSDKQSCFIVWYARGTPGTPGFVRLADVDGVEEAGTTGGWFVATPEWNHRLKQRIATRERAFYRPWLYSGGVGERDPLMWTLDQIPTYPVPNTVIGPIPIPNR